PEDSQAYAEGGTAQRLLDWTTAQMPRDKLTMLVSSLSTSMLEGTDECEHVSLEEALAPFGEISVLGDVEPVEPGSEVAFGLSGSLLSTTPQPEAGTYQLRHRTEEGDVHTVWLGTAAHLAAKMSWAERYRIGGVCVADALDPGNAEGIMDVVAGYPDVNAVPLPSLSDMQIAWTVASAGEDVDAGGGPLANPSFTWTASETPGAYTVSARVVDFDHGSVTVTVAEPEPETPSETITGTGTLTETASSTEQETGTETDEAEVSADAECLDAKYVADVTIPDNTQMEKGEPFEKTWQMQNAGTCAWPEGTVLAFVGGDQMGAPDSVDVVAVEPGGKKDVTVPMTAPDEDGTYTGQWQLKAGDTLFGGQVWVTIVVGEPQQGAAAPVPAPSGGGGFELGGHIRDGNFPYADKMHYAGMNWAKVQVHYPQDASGIIAAAHGRGFKIQLSALGTPGMVTQAGFEQDFANWVAGLAAAGADAIEVWNEPNIDREWQIGHIGPQAYTNLLCAAYQAIKGANSGTAVISAAPAPTGSFGGGCQPNGGNCDDLPFLQGMVNAGAAQCMDYIGAHHNSGATAPSARSGHPADSGGGHHSWYFLPQTELYYNTFGGARKLFYTEMGYASQEGVPAFSDWFAWARNTDNAEQAAWLAEAVGLSINTGMVRCIIVWNIDFVRYGYDPQDGYAIVRPGGGCPACDSLHALLGTR
ncbi:MAG: NBR1-Ig-like domain-containing protein, partial [Anaerolineae bacterium]